MVGRCVSRGQFMNVELFGDGVDEDLFGGAVSIVASQLALYQKRARRSDGAETADALTVGTRENSLTFVVLFAADRQDFNFPEHDE